MAALVEVERPCDGVAVVTLTLAKTAGNVSFEAVGELAGALVAAREDGARVVVLASRLPGHWLEHAWLPDLANMLDGEPTSGDATAWFRALQELTATHVVSIAAISGDTSGGGAELGWACDLRIAEEQALFSQPEVLIGLGTGIGGTSRLMRLVGRTVAAEMVLDGAPLPARRLYELGGINRVVPTGGARAAAIEWAERLATRPPTALATIKKMLLGADERHLTDALENEQRLFQKSATSPEGRAGMERVQRRLDAGESIRAIYGPPRS